MSLLPTLRAFSAVEKAFSLLSDSSASFLSSMRAAPCSLSSLFALFMYAQQENGGAMALERLGPVRSAY